jgi:dipeptidyl aminopeptidase/acylaminoacyl peptidase
MSRLALWLVLAVCVLAARPGLAAPTPAAPTLADYGKLPAVEQMLLSPSGDKLAYIAVAGDERNLVVRETTGPVLRVVDAGAIKVRDLVWLDEDHVMVTTSAAIDVDPSAVVRKSEVGQSSILNVKTGNLLLVFERQPNILHSTLGFYGFSRIGDKTYAYFGGQTLSGSGESFVDFGHNAGMQTHNYIDLYKVDLDTGHPEKVTGGSELYGSDWIVSADGEVVAHSVYEYRTGQWRLYDTPADTHLLEQRQEPAGDVALLGEGRRAGDIVVNQADEAGKWSIVEYGAGGAKATPFGDETPRAFLVDPVSRLLIGGVTNEDEPKTILFDPALQAKFDKASRAFPGEAVRLVSATPNLDRMVMHTWGPQDSGTYFFIDYPTKKITAVGWAYPAVSGAAVGATRVVAYKAADGLAMQGILTLPPGREAKNLPLVVMPHGGPQARDYLSFDWWAQAFASQGYAVFQPNFRGSNGLGRAFRDAGFGEWGRKMQTDISDGVAELVRQGLVDPKRACIVGASYGGYAALAGVTLQQGLYRCAVSYAGIGDLNALLGYEEQKFGVESAATRYDHRFLGVNSRDDSSLRALSPQKLAGHADAPVLLIHGRDDSTVPIAQSLNMRDALKSAGKPVEFVQLPGEDHYLSSQATRVQMLAASVAFVEKYNPAN